MSYKFTLLNSLQFLVYFLAMQSWYVHLYLYLGAELPTLHPRCKWFLFFFNYSSKTFAGEGLEKWFLNETKSQEYQVLFLVRLMIDWDFLSVFPFLGLFTCSWVISGCQHFCSQAVWDSTKITCKPGKPVSSIIILVNV